jgi:3-oxoacyl-[acyl-carrier protein] reductase
MDMMKCARNGRRAMPPLILSLLAIRFDALERSMKLKGKIAVITGASRGIGRAVSEGFACEGASLFLVGHVDEVALNDCMDAARRLGAEVDGGLFDVGDHAEVKRLADRIEDRYGTVDILVNNAGVLTPTPLLEITPTQWDRTIRTHLHGTFYCTMEMVNRFMKSRGAGKVINLTAPSALRGSQGVTDYASAKGGIIAFTRNAARELLPLNIQVNAVLPVADTRMTEALADYDRRGSGPEAAAMPRVRPTPEQLVPTFLFFASSDSDVVTGQILAADGGRTA